MKIILTVIFCIVGTLNSTLANAQTGSFCKFDSGPRAGQTWEQAQQLPVGTLCQDGQGSTGKIVPRDGASPAKNHFAIDPSILTIAVLSTCLMCIYMVFFFGRRLQTSAYLRDSLLEGAKQQELKILLRELRDRAMEGPLDPQNPPPEGYGTTRRLWEADRYSSSAKSPYWSRSNETPEQKAERLAEEQRQHQLETERKAWESEERVRYEALRQQAEKQAAMRAEKKIPSSIDISLLGGGFAFLLEFSTVIVIIFTLLILGIQKTLEGKDIATILAAIAGYVLGKATSATKQSEKAGGEAPGTVR